MVHLRQQRGETLRKHRLAAAGRTDHQHAVAARRCDLERAFCVRLPFDLAQIGQRSGFAEMARYCHRQRLPLRRRPGQQGSHHVEQVAGPVDHEAVADECCLLGAGVGQHQRTCRPTGLAPQRQSHRERAAYRTQVAGQRQLAGEFEAFERGHIDLTARREDTQRDRQIEAAGFLRQIGRRQIDRDALVVWKLQAAVQQRCAHPLARFLHFGIGQPDQREVRQAVREVHLDRDFGGEQRMQRPAVDDGE